MKELNKILFWDDGTDPLVDPDMDGDEGKDKDGNDGSKLFSEDEMQKAIDRRQTALKRARKAEDELKAIRENMAAMPSPEEYDDLKRNYQEVIEHMKELKARQEEEELKKIEDEKERERIKLEREFKAERTKLQSELQTMQEEINKYNEERARFKDSLHNMRREALKGHIMSAAAPKAYNPRQVVRLTIDDFTYDEEEGRWVKEVYNSAGKLVDLLTVEDAINGFLDDEMNENLLKAGVKSGSDMPRAQKATKKDTEPPTGKTPTDAMYRWAELSGLNVNKNSEAKEKAWLYDTYTRLHTKPARKSKTE